MKPNHLAPAVLMSLGVLSTSVVLAQSRPSQDSPATTANSRQSESPSALKQRGQSREVARQVEMEAVQRPADPAPMLTAAATYEAMGDLTAAAVAAERALERDAGSTDALLVLGRIAIRQQKWDMAAAYFRRAIVLDPRNRAAQLDLGQALEKAGDQAGADAAYAVFESLAADGPSSTTETGSRAR